MGSDIKKVISAELFALLRCPETHQALRLASSELVAALEATRLNQGLRNHLGNAVEYEIEPGLLRADERRFYPIREGLPILLIDESIDLPLAPQSLKDSF